MIRILLSARLGERRMTQADLVRKTGIRAATISEWYNEFVDRVNLEHLDLICKALDCEVGDLLVREDEDSQIEYLPKRKDLPKKKQK